MDEILTKTCSNCKRDIPDANFTIHSLHCVRNIRLCPVCKEPVPIEDLKEHQERLHKLSPCVKCGENVCGSDLEDHVRDSCGLTASACHYCDLELPRRDMPQHEVYCGSRTQLCECGELVMFKYMQLHEQTQHGFIKLDDEPGPEPSWKRYEAKDKPKPKQSTPVPSHRFPSNQRSDEVTNRPSTSNVANMLNTMADEYESIDTNGPNTSDHMVEPQFPVRHRTQSIVALAGRSAKRTNDMPQLNTAVQDSSKVKKNLRSNGGIKKRPAPPPPVEQLPSSSTEQEFSELLQFAQIGMAGAPMTASEFEERFTRLQVEGAPPPPLPADRFTDIKRELRELRRGLKEVTAPYNMAGGREPAPPPPPPATSAAPRPQPQFRLLDYMHPPPGYFAQSSIGVPSLADSHDNNRRSPALTQYEESELSGNTWPTCRIPCEFCGAPLLPEDLVQHSTGCRPDLTRVRTPSPPPPSVMTADEPLIPCEFCSHPCPIHLLMDHQTTCRHA